MKVKRKFSVEDDVLLYSHTHPTIMLQIEKTNKDGITWCQNCYRDDKPILVFGHDGIDMINLCEDCIKFFFKLWRESCGSR